MKIFSQETITGVVRIVSFRGRAIGPANQRVKTDVSRRCASENAAYPFTLGGKGVNMKRYLTLLALLVMTDFVNAGQQKSVTYPILGSAHQNEYRLRLYNGDKHNVPEKLKAIRVRSSRNEKGTGNPEFCVVLFKKKETISEIVREGVAEKITYLIYDDLRSSANSNDGAVLFFSPDSTIEVSEKEGNLIYSSPNGLSWQYRNTVSREGIHKIIQEYKENKCIRSIDYYDYAGYDTGGDAEAKETEQALCGNVVSAEAINP